MNERQFTVVDQLLTQFDQGLRTLFGGGEPAYRENPGIDSEEAELSAAEKRHSASLMRVNHVGEVCAQALYQGQALTARSAEVRDQMQEAAREEVDHLAWCRERVEELDSHVSYLNPFWYLGALSMGIAAGVVGDKWSLGFVAETERQVCRHLDGHLDKLPETDDKSRKIVAQMRDDEAKHATMAVENGGVELPGLVKAAMQLSAKVMTSIVYYF